MPSPPPSAMQDVYQKSLSYHVSFPRVQQTEVSVILGQFLPFYLPNNPENQNSEDLKKCLKTVSFYKCVPQMKII